MNINNPYHESISDFGCRKILGINGSALNYVNYGNSKSYDSFRRSAIPEKQNNKKKLFNAIKVAGIATASFLLGKVFGKIKVKAK